MMIKRWF